MIESSIKEQYSFCFIDGEPDSLVMTKKPALLTSQIFQTPSVIWIDLNIKESLATDIYISQQIGVKVKIFKSVKDAGQIITKLNKTIIICSNSLSQQVQRQLSKKENVVAIVCYCGNVQNYKEKKQNKKLGDKFKQGTESQHRLIDFLKQTISKINIKKQLPIFIPLRTEVQKSNIKMKTLSAMVRQKTNKAILYQEMRKLLNLIYPTQSKKMDQFCNKIKKSNQTQKQCLNFFIQSLYFHVVLNGLLRSFQHPADIFVMQPIVADMFKLIKIRYNSQQKPQKEERFYRGGHISQIQLNVLKNSVGQIVQNLGFLRVNRQKQQSQINNVLFIIIVENVERNILLDFGYTKIDGQMLLFNHLNSFKITKIQYKKQVKSYYQIQLNYGQLANIQTSKDVQKYIKRLSQIQTQCIKKNGYSTIGAVLTDGNRSLPGCLQYWEKYIQIAKQSQHKKKQQLLGLVNLGKTLFNFHEYNKAEQVFKQALIIRKQNHNDLGFATLLNNLALTYEKKNKNKEALEIYKTSLSIKKKIFFTSNPKHKIFSATINNIGKLYYKMGKYDEALNSFKQCLKIEPHQDHPNYALTLGNIASIKYMNGKYDDAQRDYIKVKEIQYRILGQSHPQYISTIKNLIKVYQKLKNNKRIKENQQELERILSKNKKNRIQI